MCKALKLRVFALFSEAGDDLVMGLIAVSVGKESVAIENAETRVGTENANRMPA